MDQLKDYEALGMNPFQMQEIRDGFTHGLTVQQVNLYAVPEFSSMQMREIRLGFEAGLSFDQVRSYAKITMTEKDMRSVRDRINEDAKIAPQRQAELHHKHLRNVLIFVLIIAGGIGAAFAGLLLTGSLNAYLQPLDLTLTADQVNIEYGSSFSPMEYVQSYTQDSAVELILPESFDANVLGDKVLHYKLKNSKKVITKELDVHVIDSKAPKLILKQNEVKLTRTMDDFHASEYIEETSDNVDGNLKDKVTYSELDTSKDEQVITYRVSDSNGNTAAAELKVTLVNPVIATPAPTEDQSSRDETSRSGEQASSQATSSSISNNTENGSRTGETKYYWFTDGYDIDSAYNACKVDGSAYGSYSCEPMMVNGLYTGYKLTYK
jgi:hypothetical protein